jgi:nitrate/nitrite transporter NarK
VALAYSLSGISLILSVGLREHFWVSYVLMCLAIPGPFAAMGPFWSIPSESLPRSAVGLVIGVVNACGNLGGFAGPYIAGWLKQEYQSLTVAFDALGAGLLIGAALAFLLPKTTRE